MSVHIVIHKLTILCTIIYCFSRLTKIQAIEAKLKMMEKSSSNEFELNDGPSKTNLCNLQRNNIHIMNRGRVTRSSSYRAKTYHKPYHRR